MPNQRKYTIDYDRDATGWWVASVRGVQGVHTQGRTIEQARERIRETLALVIGDAEAKSATFRESISRGPRRRRPDPVLLSLENAPEDDEPVTDKESAEIKEGLRELDRGEVISDKEFRRRFEWVELKREVALVCRLWWAWFGDVWTWTTTPWHSD